jgi:hypothetical protein
MNRPRLELNAPASRENPVDLNDRIEAIAHEVAKREETHAEGIASANAKAKELHTRVSAAIDLFNKALAETVPYLRVEITAPRIDDKHLHAIEFDLERGQHRAVITVKSKGEVTLVGPFRDGKKQGPCRSFPFDSGDEIEDALGDFLEHFIQAATSP